MSDFLKLNGLLYSKDKSTLIGIDFDSDGFTGKVPYGVRYIEDEAFANSNLEEIEFPDSVEAIGSCVFEGCANLKVVKLPSNMENLTPYLFSGCSSLEKVVMPLNVESFPEGLFSGCSSLKEVPFRAGIRELPENVFENCTSLKSLVIPPTVRKIASHAVKNCTLLETVVLPHDLMEIQPDSFENCPNLTNIRVDEENHLFYVNEKGLFEKSLDEDRLIFEISRKENSKVNFFEENLDDTVASDVGLDKDILEEDSVLEEDDTFSAEIGLSENENEFCDFDNSNSKESENSFINENQKSEEENMENIQENSSQNASSIDDMLSEIMAGEKERTDSSEKAFVSEKESQVLANMMEVMNDKSENDNKGSVSEDELAALFESHEKEETENHENEEKNKIDKKTQILLDSVSLSQIIECNPNGDSPENSDLFVIAEKTVDSNGNQTFSKKLIDCAKYFARVQDLQKIYMIYGLPLENDEFAQFFHYFISSKHTVVACEASNPSKLSPYCKTLCEEARISLEKDDMQAQRTKIGIKNPSLIKMIIQDKYEE